MGRLTSFVGTGMLPVALAFAVLGRHGSTSEVGYVLGAETLPLVLFLLVGGAAADRLNRRVVMLGADVLRAVAQGVLGAWILVGHPPLWGFLSTQALVGTGNAFFTPAMTGLIPEVAPATSLQQANVLNSMAEWSGRLFGPALAGVIVATAGPGWAVVADAVTYLVSALCLASLRVGWSGTTATESFLAQLRTGWRAFSSRPWLWSIVAQFSSYGFFVFAPFFVLGAVVAEKSLGGAAAWGTVLAVQGLGSVLGSVVMLRVRPRRPLVVAELALFGFALPLLALAAGAPLAVLVPTAFVSGASIGVFGPLWDTTMQSQLPPEVLSRASAYDWFGSMVFLPLGYACAGTLARLLGVDGTLYLGAGWLVLTTAVVVSLPGVTSLVAVVRHPQPVDRAPVIDRGPGSRAGGGALEIAPGSRLGSGPQVDRGPHMTKSDEPLHQAHDDVARRVGDEPHDHETVVRKRARHPGRFHVDGQSATARRARPGARRAPGSSTTRSARGGRCGPCRAAPSPRRRRRPARGRAPHRRARAPTSPPRSRRAATPDRAPRDPGQDDRGTGCDAARQVAEPRRGRARGPCRF